MNDPVPNEDGLHFEVRDAIGIVSLARQRSRNALTLAMLGRLREIYTSVDGCGVAAIVLRSAEPGAFCAGADVREFQAHAGDLEWGMINKYAIEAASAAIATCLVPTVAVIEGACVGGGVCLAVASDIRLAGPKARFAIPSTRLGMVYPYSDTRLLVESVGAHRARYLLLTATSLDAAGAFHAGLVDELFDDEASLAARVEELLVHFRTAAWAVRATKRFVAEGALGSPEPPELAALYRTAWARSFGSAERGAT